MFFLGFSAGLPLLLVFSTLSAWLTEEGVSRTAIGFFGWVGITYSIKVLWAPVIDRLSIPLLTRCFGQRRSWMLLGQLGVIVGLLVMMGSDPGESLTALALAAVAVAFASSTQDVAIDAFRIESAIDEYQGAMASTYVFGYRLAMLVAGAGSLYIADWLGWQAAYLAMAGLMLVGVLTVAMVAEPVRAESADAELLERQLSGTLGDSTSALVRLRRWFAGAVVSPFVEFFKRNGSIALVILLFIAIYRLSDIAMGIMANPFYLDLGFSKSEIASVGKVFGFFMTIFGTFIGGLLVVKYGIPRPLLAGAVMVAVTNLLFVQLARVGDDLNWLIIVISADNLGGGFSNAAFIAYLSSLTNRSYTATQYALFSSLMTLPGKFLSGFSGMVVDAAGYADFFLYTALMGIPAILLAWWVWRRDAAQARSVARSTA
ncbi:MAG: AmpG family muropeptide MFS transporter [Porticoccaceae bacterium]